MLFSMLKPLFFNLVNSFVHMLKSLNYQAFLSQIFWLNFSLSLRCLKWIVPFFELLYKKGCFALFQHFFISSIVGNTFKQFREVNLRTASFSYERPFKKYCAIFYILYLRETISKCYTAYVNIQGTKYFCTVEHAQLASSSKKQVFLKLKTFLNLKVQ